MGAQELEQGARLSRIRRTLPQIAAQMLRPLPRHRCLLLRLLLLLRRIKVRERRL
jgi:hypothetical protein